MPRSARYWYWYNAQLFYTQIPSCFRWYSILTNANSVVAIFRAYARLVWIGLLMGRACYSPWPPTGVLCLGSKSGTMGKTLRFMLVISRMSDGDTSTVISNRRPWTLAFCMQLDLLIRAFLFYPRFKELWLRRVFSNSWPLVPVVCDHLSILYLLVSLAQVLIYCIIQEQKKWEAGMQFGF